MTQVQQEQFRSDPPADLLLQHTGPVLTRSESTYRQPDDWRMVRLVIVTSLLTGQALLGPLQIQDQLSPSPRVIMTSSRSWSSC